MSHSYRDAVGGHCTHFVYDDGFFSHSPAVRRWSKRRRSKERRREARTAILQELREIEKELADIEKELHEELMSDHFYDMIYEEHLESAEREKEESRLITQYYSSWDWIAEDYY